MIGDLIAFLETENYSDNAPIIIATDSDLILTMTYQEFRKEWAERRYPRDLSVMFKMNTDAFVKETSRVLDVLRCSHYDTYGQTPCPPMCPRQSWPEYKFKKSFWTQKWKLRKKYARQK